MNRNWPKIRSVDEKLPTKALEESKQRGAQRGVDHIATGAIGCGRTGILQPGQRTKSVKRKQSARNNRSKKNDEIIQNGCMQATAATREGVVTRHKSLQHR